MKKLDQHSSIIRILNQWYEKNYRGINSTNENLIENDDFKVLIVFNGSSEEALISCSCGVKVHLTKCRESFSLSNYYKRIKSKSCTMIKKKKITSGNVNDQTNIDDDEVLFE